MEETDNYGLAIASAILYDASAFNNNHSVHHPHPHPHAHALAAHPHLHPQSPVKKKKFIGPKAPRIYRRSYRAEWEQDPSLATWLAKYEGDAISAYCKACAIKVAPRIATIKTHGETAKHMRNLKILLGEEKVPDTSSSSIKKPYSDRSDRNMDLLKACASAMERVSAIPDSQELTSTPGRRECDAVGVNVGSKLKRMENTQAIYAEAIINKVLARGLLGALRDSTDLVDVVSQPHVQQQQHHDENRHVSEFMLAQ